MKKKIFSENQIYDALSAEYNAQKMVQEGFETSWLEFEGNDDSDERNDLFNRLSQSAQNRFESLLKKIASVQNSNFDDLERLQESDFDSKEEFLEKREEIIEEIKECISYNFKEFIK